VRVSGHFLMAKCLSQCQPNNASSMRSSVFIIVASALALTACCNNPNYSPVKQHHTKLGFKNRYAHPEKGSIWKWQWERWRNGVPADPEDGYGFPVLRPDVAFLKNNREVETLTWLGHDTFLIQMAGLNIMTDPHLTERASPFSNTGPRRYSPLPMSFEDLPHVDVVLISHSHYDHLDRETLRRLSRQQGGPPRFLMGLNLRAWATNNGIENVTDHDWGDVVDFSGMRFHFVPVQHWSGRTPWDRNRTLWGGWVIEHGNRRILFGGDFGYSQDLRDLGEQFSGFDLAMIPVGSYEPRWFMKTMHVNTDEAVQAHLDLRARHSVGMHWGTFRLTDEPLDEPPAKLAESLAREGISSAEFFLMQHGETRMLEDIFVRALTQQAEPSFTVK
jgi:L-ascorbate metabolism protein UlaG (beta-lactamase superfamily)